MAFKDRVMHSFVSGKRLTYYGIDTVFLDESILDTKDYSIIDIDFNFGTIRTQEVNFSFNTNIIECFDAGDLNTI